jgi:hypothetical protein
VKAITGEVIVSAFERLETGLVEAIEVAGGFEGFEEGTQRAADLDTRVRHLAADLTARALNLAASIPDADPVLAWRSVDVLIAVTEARADT